MNWIYYIEKFTEIHFPPIYPKYTQNLQKSVTFWMGKILSGIDGHQNYEQ